MTVAELVDEGRQSDLKPFFKANAVAGAGATDGRSGETSNAAPVLNSMSPTERLKKFYEDRAKNG